MKKGFHGSSFAVPAPADKEGKSEKVKVDIRFFLLLTSKSLSIPGNQSHQLRLIFPGIHHTNFEGVA